MNEIINEFINSPMFYILTLILMLYVLLITFFITAREKRLIERKRRAKAGEAAIIVGFDEIETVSATLEYIEKDQNLKEGIFDKSVYKPINLMTTENDDFVLRKYDRNIIIIEKKDKNPLDDKTFKRAMRRLLSGLYDSDIGTLHIFYSGPINSQFITSCALRYIFVINLYEYDSTNNGYRYIGKIDYKKDPSISKYQNKKSEDTKSAHTIAFNSDGSRVAIASSDGNIRIWDTAFKKLLFVLEGHTDCVTSVECSHNGQLILSASLDKTACIWDIGSGQLLNTLHGHRGGLTSASFSPDGRHVVTTSLDKTVRLWEVSTGANVHVYENEESALYSATFSPDGTSIIISSYDGKGYEWSVCSGGLISVFSYDISDV